MPSSQTKADDVNNRAPIAGQTRTAIAAVRPHVAVDGLQTLILITVLVLVLLGSAGLHAT
ncbi:hypothetical protein [Brevundimonas sp.]|uniref:hypothetical protein n=1 Tax=Brevundimonas sp. TaxID=1871086 RepID=UPI001D8C372F|nr:hypothetical protein [Brevundimonas sp.]MBA4000124.1 hypothetical protein [Brevundimonas sp.]